MIDWQRVAELKSEVGEEAFAEVVEIFLEEVDEVDRASADAAAGRATRPGAGGRSAFPQGQRAEPRLRRPRRPLRRGRGAGHGGRCRGVDLAGVLACYAASRAAFLAGLEAGG
jgi:histidine phosphotransfer protein HptB